MLQTYFYSHGFIGLCRHASAFALSWFLPRKNCVHLASIRCVRIDIRSTVYKSPKSAQMPFPRADSFGLCGSSPGEHLKLKYSRLLKLLSQSQVCCPILEFALRVPDTFDRKWMECKEQKVIVSPIHHAIMLTFVFGQVSTCLCFTPVSSHGQRCFGWSDYAAGEPRDERRCQGHGHCCRSLRWTCGMQTMKSLFT